MDQNNESGKLVFEDEEFQRPVRSFQTPTPTSKIVGWVIKYSGGAIKDERQANYVLIGFVVVAIIIMFIFLFSGGHTQRKLTPIQIEQMRQEQVKLVPAPI